MHPFDGMHLVKFQLITRERPKVAAACNVHIDRAQIGEPNGFILCGTFLSHCGKFIGAFGGTLYTTWMRNAFSFTFRRIYAR